jgi:cytochrome P450
MRNQTSPWYERFAGWGARLLGALWPLRYVCAPFPGVVAHHRPRGWEGLVFGHARAFRRATVMRGEPASSYFRSSGIAACAKRNGGLCSFRMGRTLALYQSDNTPLVADDALAPSLDANRVLFGDFMGSQPLSHPARRDKRLAVESALGNARFVDALEPAIRRSVRERLARHAHGPAIPLDELALDLIAHIDSFAPGVLDLSQRPLTELLASAEHGRVARSYFEIASAVISKVDPGAIRDADALVPFVRELLDANFESIATAPETNLIRRYFALWGRAFSRCELDRLDHAELKELGTIIVATYDTTSLSLLWAIAYIEADRDLKHSVVQAAREPRAQGPLSLLELVVLEAVRLGGSNPTALWRRVIAPFELVHGGHAVTVPAGTMLWLDRRLANRDPELFPRPCSFNPDNVRAILRSPKETLASVLGRDRYEINSFSMVNTHQNPRKCPGRLFSVRQQAIVLLELYAAYDVDVQDVDVRLAHHSSMPRPARPGVIRITPRPPAPAAGGSQ